MNRREMSIVAAPAALVGLLALAPVASAADDNQAKSNRPFELPVTGTLSDKRQFQGSITNLAFSVSNDGKLLLSGVLNGKATGGGPDSNIKDQAFQNVPATLTAGDTIKAAFESDAADCGCAPDGGTTFYAGPMAQATTPPCTLLHLVLGPLSLNLLGLVLTIPNPIVIDLTAVPGPGNLLGNLLCAVAHLLDQSTPLGQLLGSLLGGAFLTAFLNALNMALAGL